MKKYFVLIICFLTFATLTVNVSAADEYSENLQDEYVARIFENLTDETKEILEKSNLNEFDFEKILNTSPKDIVSFFYNCISGKVFGSLKTSVYIMVSVILTTIAFTFVPEDSKKKHLFNIISCSFICIMTLPSMLSLLKSTVAVIDTSCKFMYAFLPILAGIIASCSNPVLAVSYNSLSMYLAQIISAFSNNIPPVSFQILPHQCMEGYGIIEHSQVHSQQQIHLESGTRYNQQTPLPLFG